MEKTYKITRMYMNGSPEDIGIGGLSLEEAQAHCSDPETSSSTCTNEVGNARTEKYGPWFDGYTEENKEFAS